MWMSLMTSGVKMGLRPRSERRAGWSRPTLRSSGSYRSAVVILPLLENELPLGRLEVVVVVELLAAHELLELRRRPEPVDPELALDELRVRLVPLAGHAVDPERLHLAGDVDLPVVHRVAEAGARVSA